MKKPDISGVGSYERNYDGKSSSVVVVCPLQRIVYDQMEEASSELTVAYAYGLSFGGYRERQISTRICVSRERFGEAIFFVDEKKKTATLFHQSMLVCIKQSMAGRLSSAVVCCFRVSFTIKWKKKENCQIDKRQLYSRIFVSSAANTSSY